VNRHDPCTPEGQGTWSKLFLVLVLIVIVVLVLVLVLVVSMCEQTRPVHSGGTRNMVEVISGTCTDSYSGTGTGTGTGSVYV